MINERKLTERELESRESVLKGLLSNKRNLVKKYGKDAEKVMYGIATKKAKSKVEGMNKNKIKELIQLQLELAPNNKFDDESPKSTEFDSNSNKSYSGGADYGSEVSANTAEDDMEVDELKESKGAKNYFDDLKYYYTKTLPYLDKDEKEEYKQLAKDFFSKLQEDQELTEADSKYPDFDLDKNIKYQDTSISSGMWRYTGKEQGGKGVYRNLNNDQFLGFSSDDFAFFKKHLGSHFDMSESLEEANIGLADLEEIGYTDGDKAVAMHFNHDVIGINSDVDFQSYRKGFIQGVNDATIGFSLDERVAKIDEILDEETLGVEIPSITVSKANAKITNAKTFSQFILDTWDAIIPKESESIGNLQALKVARAKLEATAKVEDEPVAEKLTKSSSVEDHIDDFKDSDAKQFKGKSNDKKVQMAVASFLSKQGKSVKENMVADKDIEKEIKKLEDENPKGFEKEIKKLKVRQAALKLSKQGKDKVTEAEEKLQMTYKGDPVNLQISKFGGTSEKANETVLFIAVGGKGKRGSKGSKNALERRLKLLDQKVDKILFTNNNNITKEIKSFSKNDFKIK